MGRSLWKENYSEFFYLNLKRKNSQKIKFKHRNLSVLKKHIGFKINIYNGRYYRLKRISEDCVGHKLGEFAFTTQMGSKIHIQKNNKK